LEPASSTKDVARKLSLCRGSRLKARRKELGLTQKELAARTGICVKRISAYENDRVEPRKENRRLLLEALDGTWLDEPLTPPSWDARPEGEPKIPERPDALADGERWCAFCREVTRLLVPREAKVLVIWRTGSVNLTAIAETHDDRHLLTIRTRATPTTLDDLRSLHAFVDRLKCVEHKALQVNVSRGQRST
jgi:transcriptional regulator with XRE-family HTH domain